VGIKDYSSINSQDESSKAFVAVLHQEQHHYHYNGAVLDRVNSPNNMLQ
jgi:hypothetical protein